MASRRAPTSGRSRAAALVGSVAAATLMALACDASEESPDPSETGGTDSPSATGSGTTRATGSGVVASGSAGAATDAGEGPAEPRVCDPGSETICLCSDGLIGGIQLCNAAGTGWGGCHCSAPTTDLGTGTGTGVWTEAATFDDTVTGTSSGTSTWTNGATITASGTRTISWTEAVTVPVPGTGTGTSVAELELVNVDGWVGGDPESRLDDPMGIQGAWYMYGDGITCVPPAGNPCTADGCCLTWRTVVDSTYESWGCGIGLELSGTGDPEAEKRPYLGTAIGFSINLVGELGVGGLRIDFTQSADTVGLVSPFTMVGDPGSYSVFFSDAICPSWEGVSCLNDAIPTTSYDIRFQIPGGDAADEGTVCITSLRPL